MVTNWVMRICCKRRNPRQTRCMDPINRPVVMPTEESTAVELIESIVFSKFNLSIRYSNRK